MFKNLLALVALGDAGPDLAVLEAVGIAADDESFTILWYCPSIFFHCLSRQPAVKSGRTYSWVYSLATSKYRRTKRSFRLALLLPA